MVTSSLPSPCSQLAYCRPSPASQNICFLASRVFPTSASNSESQPHWRVCKTRFWSFKHSQSMTMSIASQPAPCSPGGHSSRASAATSPVLPPVGALWPGSEYEHHWAHTSLSLTLTHFTDWELAHLCCAPLLPAPHYSCSHHIICPALSPHQPTVLTLTLEPMYG